MPHDLSTALDRLIRREHQVLLDFPETNSTKRPGGNSTWSPREELGHLIDSAVNNHVRFTRALIEPEFRGPRYAQNDWVYIHRYQEMPWQEIVDFWFQYNRFIATLLTRVPENKLQTPCFIGNGEAVSLEFLVDDYVLHMQHHIDHLLSREHVTAYPRT